MTELTSEPNEEKPKKGPKPKKRPSDFEIVRTIFQRTTERKLPYILRNMGESENTYVICSGLEDTFTFGNAALSITFLRIEDPELQAIVKSVLSKLHGMNDDRQFFVNLRDQISELNKTKGESILPEVLTNEDGDVWTIKTDKNGGTRQLFYCESVKSLYHLQNLIVWMQRYIGLIEKEDSPDNLYVPHTHPDGKTHTMLNVLITNDKEHPIGKLFPRGFRAVVTRGFDLLISKMFPGHFPYQVENEELIFTLVDKAICQMAHRITGNGWKMVLVRPNFVFIPTPDIDLPVTGPHVL